MSRWLLAMDGSPAAKDKLITSLVKGEKKAKNVIREIDHIASTLEPYLRCDKSHILLNEIYQLTKPYIRNKSLEEQILELKEQVKTLEDTINIMEEE